MYLIEGGDGLALVDAGTTAYARAVLAALARLGRAPRDVRHILVTHYHSDHTGGLAELAAATGATVYAHALEAPILRAGAPWPRLEARGRLGRLLLPFVNALDARASAAAPVHRELSGGEALDVAGGVRAIHVPGHTPGHLAYLWRRDGGVLFTGDAAGNSLGTEPAIVNEDNEGAEAAFRALAGQAFEVACFGHGRPILRGARAAFAKAAARLG